MNTQEQYNLDLAKGQNTLRGIIHVDEPSFFYLSVKLPTNQPEIPTARLWNVLFYLADIGYRVTVTEMLAFKLGAMLYDGTIVSSDVQNDRQPLKPLLRKFFDSPDRQKSIHIIPPHSSDTTDAAILLRNIRRICKSGATEEEKYSGIAAALEKPITGFSHIAAQQYLRFIKHTDLPVFCLSDNPKTLDAAMANGVTPLTMFSFLQTLTDHGVLEKSGFVPQKAKQLVSTMEQHMDSAGLVARLLFTPKYTNATRLAFNKTLADICISDAKANEFAEARDTATEKFHRPSRVESFYQKYPTLKPPSVNPTPLQPQAYINGKEQIVLNQAQGSDVPRGIILVDTTSLFSLSVVFSTDHPKKPIAPLLDIFLYLANNGFKIVVPKMVYFEASNTFHKGGKIKSPSFSRKLSLKKSIEDFLLDAVSDGLIHIAQPHESDQTAPAILLRKIQQIQDSEKTRVEKDWDLVAALEPRREHFGDIAAQEYLRFMEKTDLPIFYFSDDAGALDAAVAVRGDLCVTQLTMLTFLRTLSDYGILTKAGFAPLPLDDLILTMSRHREDAGLGSNFLMNQKYTNHANWESFGETLIDLYFPEAVTNEQNLSSQTENLDDRYRGCLSANSLIICPQA